MALDASQARMLVSIAEESDQAAYHRAMAATNARQAIAAGIPQDQVLAMSPALTADDLVEPAPGG